MTDSDSVGNLLPGSDVQLFVWPLQTGSGTFFRDGSSNLCLTGSDNVGNLLPGSYVQLFV